MKNIAILLFLSLFLISCVKTNTVYIEKPPAKCENTAKLVVTDMNNQTRIDSLENIETNEDNVIQIKEYIKTLRGVVTCYEDQINGTIKK
jgi:PBP1b-binding outer membrane lipoprotein LpoB